MAYQYGTPGYGYNPQQTYFAQQQYNPQPQQQMSPAFACHPVGSREEAVAAQTDYFSAGLVMPDLSHGMIYLKRFNQQTGASDFFEFRAVQPEEKKEKEEEDHIKESDYKTRFFTTLKLDIFATLGCYDLRHRERVSLDSKLAYVQRWLFLSEEIASRRYTVSQG